MGGEAKPLRHHPALRRLGKRHLATLLGGVVALVVLAFAIARSSFAGDESYGDDEPAFGSFGSLRLGASDRPARPRAERWLGDRAGSGAFASRMDRARSSIDALSLARDDRAGGAGTQHPTPRGDRERRRGARDRDGPRGFPRAFEDDVPDDDDDDASGAAGTRDASEASSRARSSDVDHRGALALGGERLPTPLDLAPPSLSRRSTRVESSLDWMRSHLGGGGARADARPARPPPVIEPIDFDADDAKDSAAGDARLATPFRSSSSDLIHAASHHRASSATPSSASSSSCARCGHRGACASPSTSSSSFSSSACRCATAWEGRACRSPRSLGSHPPSFVASGYEVNGGAFALPELTLTRANAPDTLEVRLRRDDVAPARVGVVSASARARLPDVDPLEGRWFDSCAVVGGGGSLLGSGRGADIDAHAAVFRFGRAPTVGFERDAGSRTTHRVVDDAGADFRESAGEVVLRIARSKRAFRDVFHQLALAKERARNAKTRGGVFARVSSYFGPYRPADDEENEGGGAAESSASSVSYALTPAFLAWLDDAFAFEPAPELVGVVVATLKCARVELFGFQMQSFDGVKDRYHEPDDDGSVFENEIPSVVGYEARGGAGKSRGAEGSEGGFASGFGGLGGSDHPSDADSDASDADSDPVAWPTKSAMDGNEFAVLKAMASRGFVGFAEPCVVRCHEGAESCDACLAADAELAADDDAAGDAEGGSGGANARGVFGGPRFGGGARGIGDRVAGWMTEVGDALSHSLGERRGDGNGGDAAEFVEFWRRGGGARGRGVPGDRGEKKAGFGDEDGFEAFEDVNGDSYGEDPGLEDAEPTTRADETTLFARGAGDGGKVRESLTPRRAGGAFRGYE